MSPAGKQSQHVEGQSTDSHVESCYMRNYRKNGWNDVIDAHSCHTAQISVSKCTLSTDTAYVVRGNTATPAVGEAISAAALHAAAYLTG